MPPCQSSQSTRKGSWMVMSFVFGMSEFARAAAGDCAQIDANAAAAVLGVHAARADPANPAHSELEPDKMKLLACSYAEATVDPMARTLAYFIYTPIPADLASVYTGLASGNFPRKQMFSPNVGSQSSGWFRSSARDDTFEGYIAMRIDATITVIKIGGMPSSDAVKNALITAGKILAKP